MRAVQITTNNICGNDTDTVPRIISTPISNTAAVVVGIDRRSEKRAVSGRDKPKKRPAVMVMPDLLTPGTSDRT